ncbi:MAG TPA: serine protease [Kofleriaceae bacterium]|nr:serine protease [Kofleriaceae bacterium]
MLKTISCILVLSSPALAGTLEAPVVGGTPAPAGKWPAVALVVAPTALCTGTLIAPDVVLTAGHCIDVHPELVVIGTVDYSKPGGEEIAVKSAIAYPEWQKSYDVGVLVLEHAAKTEPGTIAAACTAESELVAGAKVEVVGFGLTTKSGTGSNTKLEQGALPVDDASCTQDPACQPAIAPGGEFTAGGNGTDSCFGDSGGPLYLGDTEIGVVSRGVSADGKPCGGGGVYVRADRVVSWIESVTKRKIARSTCDGKADGGDGGDDAAAGGCDVAGGALGGGALVLAALAWLLAIPRKPRG